MTNWQEVRLGDICIQITDGTHNTVKDCESGDCYLLSCKNIKNGNIEIGKNERKIDRHTLEELRKRTKTAKGDVLLSSVGTIGETAVIKLENPNYEFQRSVAIFKPNLNFITSEFLYYSLNSRKDILQHSAEGAVQQCLFINPLKDFSIPLPPLDVQKKIAVVLGALDDKIELNNRINNNLEQQAQALFKSWFMDFEPFGGTMPDDWKVGKLGDFIEIKRGGSPRPIQEYLVPNGLNWLKISDATAETSPYILEIKEHIKPEGLNKTVFLKKGSLVLSNSATPGIPKFLDIDTCIHDGWLYFPNSLFSNEYLFLLFNHIRKDLISLGNGSVFTNLKTDILKNFEAILPTKEVLRRFDSIISSIFISIKYNREEIATLTTLRDMLLPKLMSGEIDVSNVDISALTSTDKLSFRK